MNSDKCQEISAKLLEPESPKFAPGTRLGLLTQTFGLNATQRQNLTLSNVILGWFLGDTVNLYLKANFKYKPKIPSCSTNILFKFTNLVSKFLWEASLLNFKINI